MITTQAELASWSSMAVELYVHHPDPFLRPDNREYQQIIERIQQGLQQIPGVPYAVRSTLEALIASVQMGPPYLFDHIEWNYDEQLWDALKSWWSEFIDDVSPVNFRKRVSWRAGPAWCSVYSHWVIREAMMMCAPEDMSTSIALADDNLKRFAPQHLQTYQQQIIGPCVDWDTIIAFLGFAEDDLSQCLFKRYAAGGVSS